MNFAHVTWTGGDTKWIHWTDYCGLNSLNLRCEKREAFHINPPMSYRIEIINSLHFLFKLLGLLEMWISSCKLQQQNIFPTFRMPPGPKGYPLLGNVLQTNFHNIVESLTKWTEEFGDIFKINLLGQDIVVVRFFKLFTVDILLPRESDIR